MFTIFGPRDAANRLCNGTSRRSFLQIGALGTAGLTLPQLLQLEAQASAPKRHKSVIMIYLCGGPPHQDMYDLKLDAPSDVRGPFRPIDTNVDGIQFCEKLPMLASMADKLIPIRTMIGSLGDHAGYQCFTGRSSRGAMPSGGWPHTGSAVAKFQGPVQRSVPPFISLCYTTQHRPYNEPDPGYLGISHSSFRPNGPSRDDMVLQGITSDRLADRRVLLTNMDRMRRDWDASGEIVGVDAFTQQALGILSSRQLSDALDLSSEDPSVVERYGTYDASRAKGDGAPRVPQNLLAARRLVEAGARFVTVNYSFWDWHSNNFKNAEDEFPIFDKALSALVEDLHQRGMDQDVTVIAWGEFGRTPKINDQAGRDHWPRVSCALMAGGGMRTGQVIGQTDRLGGEAVDRPVTFAEVTATLYHNLGIDTTKATVLDLNGRPQYLVDPDAAPMRELI